MFRYKLALKILVIFIFALPVMWIVLDPAGQRWADVTLLRLLGNPAINLDFAGLDGNEDLDELKTTYPQLELNCDANGRPKATELNRNCYSHVAAINGLPARYLTFFMQDGRLKMLKLSYRASYHEAYSTQLTAVYGEPRLSTGSAAAKVVQWSAGPGRIVMKAQVSEKGDNQLFWLRPGYEPN